MPVETIEQTAEVTTEQTAGDEGGTTPSVQPAVDRASMESKMEATLAAARKGGAFGDDDDAMLDESVSPTGETGETNETVVGDGAQDTLEGTEGEQTETVETPAAVANAPTLPDAYRRSLKAYDWTDAEIDSNFKALGPKFLETAAKMHTNRNAELQKWADIGRQQRTQQGNQPAPVKLEKLAPVDLQKLKDKYEDDTIVNEIAGPINAVIEQINAVLPLVQQTQARAQQDRLETLATQIDTFFGSKALEPYAEVYGKNSDKLNEKQFEARNKVLEMADALTAGASAQGRTLKLNEALTLSLDSLSGDMKEKVVRQKIVGTMKQRNKGITITPTSRATGTPAKAGDRSALENKVKAGLAKAFG